MSRRWLGGVLARTLALTVAVPATVVGILVTATPANAVSTTPTPCADNGVDESTSRDAALSRARSWLNPKVPYSQLRCYQNQYGDYRTDCSGFVAMAWGIGGRGSDWWTGNLYLKTTPISASNLQPGDALLRHTGDPNENHVALFVRWYDSAHTKPVVLEQTGNDAIEGTVERAWTWGYSGYTPVRYDKITTGPDEPEPYGDSVTGDAYTDLLTTKSDGTLWVFSNNFVRDGGQPYGSSTQIGSGWGNYPRILPADATGDRYTDLVATKTDGTTWLFSNNIGRDGVPYKDYRQLTVNLTGYNRVVPADVTGDGYTDLVATKSDGTLWLFANNFVRDGGQPYGSATQIGSGWGNYSRIIGADATGDRYTDLVATKTDGTTWLFSNNVIRDGGVPYKDYRQLTVNLTGYNRVVPADATGDGYTDLVATKTDGTSWLLSNNIVRDGGQPYGTSRQLTPNLSTYNRVL